MYGTYKSDQPDRRPPVAKARASRRSVHMVPRPRENSDAWEGSLVSDELLIKTAFDGQPTETFAAGQTIFCEEDPTPDIFWIICGQLQLYKTLTDGRRAVTGFVFPDEFVGLPFHQKSLVSAESLTDLKLRRTSRRRLQDMANGSPPLRSEISALISRDLHNADDHILLLARMNAEERLARFLLDVHQRSHSGNEFFLPMSRSDVADYLGLTVETVSRMVSCLTRKGLIATSRLGHIVKVNEITALSKIAQMDHHSAAGA